MESTKGVEYTRYLASKETGWRRWVDVQWPYRRHLRSLELGFVLDLGCGLGRNLANLGGHGVGIDHNPHSVAGARERGLEAYTPEEFRASPRAAALRFDSLLFSHVAEHMPRAEAVELLRAWLAPVRPGGQVVLMTPQERGYASDPTHVTWLDFAGLRALASEVGLQVESEYSFPFPRFMGRLFIYNEFVTLCRR